MQTRRKGQPCIDPRLYAFLEKRIFDRILNCNNSDSIGPLQDPVTWYGINYAGTPITQWDFQNKRTVTSPARFSFVLKAPLRYLRPSIIYSVPCDRNVQRTYSMSDDN